MWYPQNNKLSKTIKDVFIAICIATITICNTSIQQYIISLLTPKHATLNSRAAMNKHYFGDTTTTLHINTR